MGLWYPRSNVVRLLRRMGIVGLDKKEEKKGINMSTDRKRLFSEWNDVALRIQKDGTYVCYECKLWQNEDTKLEDVYTAIKHTKLHEEAGHKLWDHVVKDLHLTKKIAEESVTEVELFYSISNNGDGSASVHFFKSHEDAKAFDKYEQEHYDGWGESEHFKETLYFDKDGILINASEGHEEEEGD